MDLGALTLDGIEVWLTRLGGAAGIAALCVAFFGIWRASHRNSGRETGKAERMLRTTTYLLIGIPYFLVCVLIWKPLSFSYLSLGARILALVLGFLLYSLGLILYLWAWMTLGRYYNVASGFGVRLFADHQLITEGPYAWVRHPMYLGFQLAAFGGVFLFKTWTMVFLFVNFLFLVIRARREEQALAEEYPIQWEMYCKDVPAWFPNLPRKKSR